MSSQLKRRAINYSQWDCYLLAILTRMSDRSGDEQKDDRLLEQGQKDAFKVAFVESDRRAHFVLLARIIRVPIQRGCIKFY